MMFGAFLVWRFLVDGAADVDEIIGDHAEPDPTLHPIFAFVATTIEPVSSLRHADAALASGTPFLTVAEPALLCSRRRSALLVERLGMHTRLTPLAFAV